MKKILAMVVLGVMIMANSAIATDDVALWASAKKSKAGKEYHQAMGTLEALNAFVSDAQKSGDNMFSITVNPRKSKQGNQGYDLFLKSWKGTK